MIQPRGELCYLLDRDGVELGAESARYVPDGDLHGSGPAAQVPALDSQQGASFHRTPQGGDLMERSGEQGDRKSCKNSGNVHNKLQLISRLPL